MPASSRRTATLATLLALGALPVAAHLAAARRASTTTVTPQPAGPVPPPPGDTIRDVLLTGVVRRADEGRPVPAAQVALPALNLGTTTDAAGRWALRLHAARGTRVTVRVRADGHAEWTGEARVDGDTVRVDVALTPTGAMVADGITADSGRRATGAELALPAPPPPPVHVSPALPAQSPMGTLLVQRSAAKLVGIAGGVSRGDAAGASMRPPREAWRDAREPGNREGYDRIEDNPFLAVAATPRSTFSVDVDRASYGNVRRFLAQGQRPPADAVRLEELINYFPYANPAPRGDAPIAVTTEVSAAPWRPAHRLVRIALQARALDVATLPPSNLVFLVDVSGSMQAPDKLPLVQQSLRLLVDHLRPQDRVAIVAYAGAAGLVLPSTPGSERARIAEAIDRLEAGGSTAGGAGLELAYRVAREHFRPDGVNRVVLATDGDFNVGPSSDAELERLVERRRADGTYLTVLGFGTGNYQDAKMKKLAKIGNGNYAYVDALGEARKVLVHELGATLVTVANDVKLQVEFNPATVRGYRLLGYEGRLLRDEDFADDAKDAGDVGSGHAVTALYEIVPAGVDTTVALRGVPPRRYGATPPDGGATAHAGELLQVQLRWKTPGEGTSRLLTHVVGTRLTTPSADFRFAQGVAAFGLVLRDSPHRGAATLALALDLARAGLGADPGGYRAEFVRMVERARELRGGIAARDDAAR